MTDPIDIPSILEHIRPGASWTLEGDDIEQLTWLDENTQKPTLAEIEAAQTEVLTNQISEKRKLRYIQEADPLFFKWQRGEITKEAWLASVIMIRSELPYPEETEPYIPAIEPVEETLNDNLPVVGVVQEDGKLLEVDGKAGNSKGS